MINLTDRAANFSNDFEGGRGAVMLATDVREYLSDSESLNDALRALIGLSPQKRRSTGAQ